MDAERKVAPSLFYLAEEKERECGDRPGDARKREEKKNEWYVKLANSSARTAQIHYTRAPGIIFNCELVRRAYACNQQRKCRERILSAARIKVGGGAPPPPSQPPTTKTEIPVCFLCVSIFNFLLGADPEECFLY